MGEERIEIKYEQLSAELQSIISEYHQASLNSGSERTFDDSVRCWFDEKFDSWFSERFADNNSSRKSHRVDVELPVKIVDTLSEAEEDADIDLDLVGVIINISRGGLYFKSSKPIDKNNVLKVIIDMSSAEADFPQIEAIAMVIRCEKLNTADYGIGLMFSSVYNDDRQTLDLFILRNLSYYLYK